MLNNNIIGILESMGIFLGVAGVIFVFGILALAVRCMRKVEPGTVGVRTGWGGIKIAEDYIIVLPLLHK